ncbi:PH domain-containing protein [Magnetococcales bacterium HHB-1]
MGLLSSLTGNASEVDLNEISEETEAILIDQEQVIYAFKLVRDLILFTDKRMIVIDKQGITGKKVEYLSVPYRSITHFAVETAGHFDDDSELKVWVTSMDMPICKEFKRGTDIKGVQKAIAMGVLGL